MSDESRGQGTTNIPGNPWGTSCKDLTPKQESKPAAHDKALLEAAEYFKAKADHYFTEQDLAASELYQRHIATIRAARESQPEGDSNK